jgi:DNA-binding beta-propeller fold protein YncE
VSSALVEGSTSIASPDGAYLYVWNPFGLELNRIELATGNVNKAKAAAVTASAANPLAAFGRWLAPPTLAKMFLQPGVAISPDGTRLYGLGILGDPAAGDFSGSAGVVVFDTQAMTSLGRWEPTADFVSIAVSPDGAFVYASGMSGVDATGRETSQPASITVFNAADGSIRLIAGDLGRGMLSFAGPALN